MISDPTPNGRDSTPDLPNALAEAGAELPPQEFSRTVRLGEEAAQRAAVRASWAWVLWLVIGAGLLVGLIHNAWLLFPTALLMIWMCLPFIVAAEETAAEDAEADVLHRASEQHRREAQE